MNCWISFKNFIWSCSKTFLSIFFCFNLQIISVKNVVIVFNDKMANFQ